MIDEDLLASMPAEDRPVPVTARHLVVVAVEKDRAVPPDSGPRLLDRERWKMERQRFKVRLFIGEAPGHRKARRPRAPRRLGILQDRPGPARQIVQVAVDAMAEIQAGEHVQDPLLDFSLVLRSPGPGWKHDDTQRLKVLPVSLVEGGGGAAPDPDRRAQAVGPDGLGKSSVIPERFLMPSQETLQVLAKRKPDCHFPAEAQDETERLDGRPSLRSSQLDVKILFPVDEQKLPGRRFQPAPRPLLVKIWKPLPDIPPQRVIGTAIAVMFPQHLLEEPKRRPPPAVFIVLDPDADPLPESVQARGLARPPVRLARILPVDPVPNGSFWHPKLAGDLRVGISHFVELHDEVRVGGREPRL